MALDPKVKCIKCGMTSDHAGTSQQCISCIARQFIDDNWLVFKRLSEI